MNELLMWYFYGHLSAMQEAQEAYEEAYEEEEEEEVE